VSDALGQQMTAFFKRGHSRPSKLGQNRPCQSQVAPLLRVECPVSGGGGFARNVGDGRV